MSKSENVVKFHRNIHLNIGVLVFVIIIVYVIFNVFSFLTSVNVAEYEVTKGTIASNNVYKGLVLRDETVYYAEEAGFVNYYIKDGSKAGVGSVVCSIDTTGEISGQITAGVEQSTDLNPDVVKNVVSEMSSYSEHYDPLHFSTVYNFKNDINSELSQNLSTVALSNLGNLVDQALKANTFYLLKPTNPGVVVYAVDGMETKKEKNFTPEDLNSDKYKKTNLNMSDKVNVADPVFKLVNSERWNVILPVTDAVVKKLKDKDVVKVRMCLDGYQTYATFTVIQKSGNYYLDLGFSNAMIRYLNERYLDVELVLDVEQGLKIPNSSIVKKKFFKIPENYFARGDNSSSMGVLIQKYSEGKKVPVFETPAIYARKDGFCYVDGEKLEEGDVLINGSTNENYVVGTDSGSLKGVYNINKGYAVFKQIEILYQNEEYTIVAQKTDYGIDLYDHIALDSSKVKENELIFK